MNPRFDESTFNQAIREAILPEFEDPEYDLTFEDLFDAAQGIAGPQKREAIAQACQENPGLAAAYAQSRKDFKTVRLVQEDRLGFVRLWLSLSGQLRRDPVLARQVQASDERKRALHGDTLRRSSAWTWSAVSSVACAGIALFLIAPRLLQSNPEWIGVRGIGDTHPLPSNTLDTLSALKLVQDPKRDIQLVIPELELQLDEDPQNQNVKDLLIYFYRLAQTEPYEPIISREDRIAYRAKLENLEKQP